MLRQLFDKIEPNFLTGGRLSVLHPLYDAIDTFLFNTGSKTSSAPHVRDGIDLKRVMLVVVVALLPCVWMAMWNTGLQANTALVSAGITEIPGWRGAALAALHEVTPTDGR